MRRRGGLGAAVLGAALLLGGCTSTGAAGRPSVTSSATRPAAGTPTPRPSPTPAPLVLQRLGTFSSPVWVGPAPGDAEHLYLAQRDGLVLQLAPDGTRESVILDVSHDISKGAEQGLLSIAFDPAYARNHRLYVDYTDAAGSTRVVAYTVVDDLATRPEPLLAIGHPYKNNNGGQLLFDRTGKLLVGTGDGGNAGDPQNNAQDLGSLLGKILRIDPRTGAAAKGNPFPGAPYVWAFGLRNPWRFSFDTNGYLWLGDSGQTRVEELDVVPPVLQPGANYGWSVYEGDDVFKHDEQLNPMGHLVAPALTFPHVDGGCAIRAGFVYHGSAIPSLRGSFLYGDYCLGRLMALTRTSVGLGTPQDLDVRAQALQAFGQDAHGELLVLTVDTLSRLVQGPLPSG